jgi:hypothetical protein
MFMNTRDLRMIVMVVDEACLIVLCVPAYELKIALNACSCKSFCRGHFVCRITRELLDIARATSR